MSRAAIYCRTGQHHPARIKAQRAELERLMRAYGYSEFLVYEDDGESGLTDDRPAFNASGRTFTRGRSIP